MLAERNYEQGAQPLRLSLGKRRIGRMILGVLFLIPGGAGTWLGGSAILTWATSGTWMALPAEVIASEVDSAVWETRRTGSGMIVRSETRYQPFIRYQYQVRGDMITSDRIRFGEKLMGNDHDAWMSSREPAQEIISRYPEGSTIAVYVNPRDPQQAVIERRIDFSTWRALALGTLCSFIGLRLWMSGMLRDVAAARTKSWLLRRSICRWDLLTVAVLLAGFYLALAKGHSF